MFPSLGKAYFIHPFKVHAHAGVKVVVQRQFGVDYLARLPDGSDVMVFASELLLTS